MNSRFQTARAYGQIYGQTPFGGLQVSQNLRGLGADSAGVAAVVLVLLGGTTWLSGGFWAPDGIYSRFVSPALGLGWGLVVSGVLLTRSSAIRAGW